MSIGHVDCCATAPVEVMPCSLGPRVTLSIFLYSHYRSGPWAVIRAGLQEALFHAVPLQGNGRPHEVTRPNIIYSYVEFKK